MSGAAAYKLGAIARVIELQSEQEWQGAVPVLRVLRPSLNAEQFISRREKLASEGYRLIGVQVDDTIVSIASYTLSPHATLGRELLIHDMASLPQEQGKGHATMLIEALVTIAGANGCGRLFVHTRNAQPLYTRNGFDDYSSGMIRRL